MEIIKLEGKLVNNVICPSITIDEMKQIILNGDIMILSNCFHASFMDQLVKSLHYNFRLSNKEENPIRSVNTKAFHRIDDNHPKSFTKRMAHIYRFSYAHKGVVELFDLFHPINLLRNKLADIDENFSISSDFNGFCSQPGVIHYPSGGGFMERHIDPVYPQFVEMVVAGSQKGVDYIEGGLEIENKKEWIDADSIVCKGDIIMFRPDLPHRVSPIDPNKKVDWDKSNGRWTFFSPIANIIASNNDVNDKIDK